MVPSAGVAEGVAALLSLVQRHSAASEPEELRLAAVDALASSGETPASASWGHKDITLDGFNRDLMTRTWPREGRIVI